MDFYFLLHFISTVERMQLGLYKEDPISLEYGEGKRFNIQVLRVDGLEGYGFSFDNKSAPSIKTDLMLYFGNGPQDIDATCLDLSSAAYCDQSGLAAVLVHRRLGELAGIRSDNIIVSASPAKRNLVRSQLDTILNVHDSVQDLVDYYRSQLQFQMQPQPQAKPQIQPQPPTE